MQGGKKARRQEEYPKTKSSPNPSNNKQMNKQTKQKKIIISFYYLYNI